VSDPNNIVIDNGDGEEETITVEQQANLRKLAEHLLAFAPDYPDFAMDLFTRDERDLVRGYGHAPAYKAECGTAACAVGHGPIVGFAPLPDERWTDYSHRVFVGKCVNGDDDIFGYQGKAWEWCFGGAWSNVDNTAHGAAYRIFWLLDNRDIPEDAEEQREGCAPISYRPEVEPALA